MRAWQGGAARMEMARRGLSGARAVMVHAALLISLAAAKAVAQNPQTLLGATWVGDPNLGLTAQTPFLLPGIPMSAALPIWSETGRPTLLFAKDHSVGYYIGFNAQGSWIRHESGAVYVFDRTHGTLKLGAASLDAVPRDVALPTPTPTQFNVTMRVHGMITRGSDGLATLTYDLLEPGKPSRKMTFTGLMATNLNVGDWAWIGDASQADPAMVADEPTRSRLAQVAPGEPVGSAGIVDVNSTGEVNWQLMGRAAVTPYFARGEHGKLTRGEGGQNKLSFTLVLPGKADRTMTLSVARGKTIVNPVLEVGLMGATCGDGQKALLPYNPIFGGRPMTTPPLLDLNDAWVWIDANKHDPYALIFNMLPDGRVRWNVVSPGLGAMVLAGPTPADITQSGGVRGGGATAATPPAPGVDDPYLKRETAPQKPPFKTAAIWSYLDSTIPSVWYTATAAFDTVGRTPKDELVYLGFNARGSWLESCDGTKIYTWDGVSPELVQAAQNMSGVPTDLANPSDFMRRYMAWKASSGGRDATASQNSTPDPVDPLQAAGFIPGDADAASFSAPVGNSSGGSGAKVVNGVLTFKDSQSGATVSMHVVRPAFIAAQPQVLKSMGITGGWVWVSEDRQQGRVIAIDQDGSVKITVVPVQMAISMAGAQH